MTSKSKFGKKIFTFLNSSQNFLQDRLGHFFSYIVCRPQNDKKSIFGPFFWKKNAKFAQILPKNEILAKIGDILGHKIVKNDFFQKSHHKKLDIHEIFHFSPYLDY